MEFKATTNTKTMLDWFQAIIAVADECIIDTSEIDVLSVRVVDPANALMLEMRIEDSAWDELAMGSGRFGINVETVIHHLKTFDPAENCTISLEDAEIKLSCGSAWYTIPVLQPENMRTPPKVPKLDLPAQIIIDAARLQRMVRQALSVSDHIRIGLNPAEGTMFVNAVGDVGKFGDTALFDGEVVVLPKHRVAVSSLYSLDYFHYIVKHTAGDVVIDLGGDLPIVMSFMLHDATVCYVQAPRIEKD